MTPNEVDDRLSAVERNVKAGRFVEDTWDVFRLHYFRNCTDTEAADLLRAWCDRKGFIPTLREGRTDIGSTPFKVVFLRLELRS